MVLKVEFSGTSRIDARSKTFAHDVTREMIRQLWLTNTSVAADMRRTAAGQGTLARKAASTIKDFRGVDFVEVRGGRGAGLPQIVFMGSEFGGRKKRKTYQATSSKGRVYTIRRRRVTMMFRKFTRRGYFFRPAIRKWTPIIRREMVVAARRGVR